MPAARVETAPAKINLTLRVIGRRADGYHDIESLVAFAALGDQLAFTPARTLALSVRGPTARAAGELADNLVLQAARSLAERVEGLKVGRFALDKRLPVAAGLGGGSADAAAALRLLARANRIALDDPRLLEAARKTGADVPVCVEALPRMMRGVGDILGEPLDLPRLPAVLVNPGVAVATRDVFAALRIPAAPVAAPSVPAGRRGGWRRTELLAALSTGRNDLEPPAIKVAPIISGVLSELRASAGCALARMSGSGATCFGLFESARAATEAARGLRSKHPGWWVRATVIGEVA